MDTWPFWLALSIFALLVLVGRAGIRTPSRTDNGPATSPPTTPTTASRAPLPTRDLSRITPVPTPVPPPTLTPVELKALLDGTEKPIVYDARTREEYDEAHLPGALSLPLTEVDEAMSSLPRDRLLVFYCHGGT
ncbi:MAG: rhodanese-like domain-containing protein [Chloroflexota bacterium]